MARDEDVTAAAVNGRKLAEPLADGVGTDVFLSYSRRDRDFVERLNAALVDGGKNVYVDWEDIPDWSSDYEAELFDGIDRAESFLFVLSPDSLASPNCRLELEHATAQGKRITPLLRRDPDSTPVPEPLRRPQWLDFRDDDAFDEATARLLEALSVDADWLRKHTRFGVRAGEWDRRGRDSSFLLQGSDLREAEAWLAEQAGKDPPPTELQSRYVNASRRAATRRQRIAMAAVAVALAVAIALAVFSLIQRHQAITQRDASNSALLLSTAGSRDATLDIALLLSLAAASTEADSPEVESSMIGALIRARQTRAEAILHDDTAVATSVDWSTDGRLLATASENGTVRLWRFGTRERLSPPLQGDGVPLNVVAFDPTRAVVAAGGRDGLFLWWLKDGRALRRLRMSTRSITALAYGSDGALVAGTEQGALSRWDTPRHSGAELATISGPITAVAVAKDGAIAYANDNAAFVRPRSGRSSVPVAHVPQVVHALAFSPTDPTLAIGGGDENGTEHIGVVQIVDSATLDPVARTSVEDRPTDFVHSLSFSRDGATLAGAGPDGSVWLWNARTAVKQDRYGADGGHLHDVAFSPTARSMFAAAANYGAILVWKAGHPAFGTPTTDAETGRELATARAGGVVELSGPHARTIAGAGDIERVALSDNGEWLAAATSAGLVRVWATASGGPIARIQTGPVTALAVDDKGELVAGGTASGLVRLWDVGAARRVDPALRANSARVDVVAFSPKGAMLATSGEDATTYLWDVRTHRKLAALRVGPQASSLDFSPDGRLLATGQGDGVRLWDTRAHIRLVDHVGSWSVTDVAFSPDGRRLLSRDTDGLHVWDGILWSDYDDLQRQVCSLVFPGIARGAEWRELAPNLGYRETCPSG